MRVPPMSPDGVRLLMAGAGGIDPLVQDIGICLLIAGALLVVFERVRIPSIAALLVAGVLIGPEGLSIVSDKARIETIAALGLTLLLFVIGLEVNVRALLASGKTILVTGALQVPLTIAIAWSAFSGVGALGLVEGDAGGYTRAYFAIACAFSSTLLVVKQLQVRYEGDSPSGRLAVAILIFQDIWAIVVLALQPNFASPDLRPVIATFVGTIFVILVAVTVARWVLPAAFRLVAKVPELVVSVALAWCFGLGLFGAHLGAILHAIGVKVEVSVSLEMAALIAGATIASFPYAHEVVAKVTSLRDFFVTLFFVALGMSLPLPTSGAIFVAVLVAAVAVALRLVVFLPLLYVAGADRRLSVITSARLAQVSEFCLVIVYLGRSLGHVSADVVAAVIFAFVMTALLTPLLFDASEKLDDRIGPLLGRLGMRAPHHHAAPERQDHPRVVLLGFHRLASSLLHDLETSRPDLLPHVLVIDLNVAVHDALRARGVRVVYGDVANPDTLKHAHVAKAEVIVSTVPDDILRGTSNLKLVRLLRKMAPDAKVVANAIRLADAAPMQEAGADHVFSWRTETSRALTSALTAILDGQLEALREEVRETGRDLSGRRELID